MPQLQDQMPVVEQDPTDQEFVQNPYDFYRRVRPMGNFVYWKDYDLPVAVTQSAVAQVLKHPKLGRAIPDKARANRTGGT